MKKVLCVILAMIMVLVLVACGSGDQPQESTSAVSSQNPSSSTSTDTQASPSASGDETPQGGESGLAWNPDNIREQTFVMAHGLPATGMTGIQYNEFAVAIEELSGGKMTVDQRIGGTLLTDTETLEGVMMGTVDFVHNLTSFASGTVTDVSPLSMPGYYAGNDWFGFLDSSRDILTEIYAPFNIKYLGSVGQGHAGIVSTERQICTPADVAGLSMRASGTWISRCVEAWGGSATMIGLADLPDALQRGIVQGTCSGMAIIVPFQLYEIAEYVTFTTMCETFGALLMIGERWAELNADEQALIVEATKIFEQKSYDIAQEFMNSYREDIENSGLNQTHSLTQEEQKLFTDIVKDMFDEMAPELSPSGLKLIELLKEAS